jgi:hypothetical protein
MNLKIISTGSIGNAYILSNGDEALLSVWGKHQGHQEALDFDLSK